MEYNLGSMIAALRPSLGFGSTHNDMDYRISDVYELGSLVLKMRFLGTY